MSRYLETSKNLVKFSLSQERKLRNMLEQGKSTVDVLSDIIYLIYSFIGARCEFCGSSEDELEAKLKRCNNCKEVYYCSRECQKKDWKRGHRDTCEGKFETSDQFFNFSFL